MKDLLIHGQADGASYGVTTPDGATAIFTNLDVPQTLEVGRTHRIAIPAEGLERVEILRRPDFGGSWTVNPDLSIAAVLTDTSIATPVQPKDGYGYDPVNDPADYEIRDKLKIRLHRADGETEDRDILLRFLPQDQRKWGSEWSRGEHYLMPTDETGAPIFKPGPNHQSIYISGRPDAWTRDRIAEAESMDRGNVGSIWLNTQDTYGRSPEMAIGEDVITRSSLHFGSDRSCWLFYERGHAYDFDLNVYAMNGISPLHPTRIAAFGEGARPHLRKKMHFMKKPFRNMVFEGIDFAEGFTTITPGAGRGQHDFIMLDDCQCVSKGDLNIQGCDHFTFRRSQIFATYHHQPWEPEWTEWPAHRHRHSGVYSAGCFSPLFEECFFDQAGFDLDYAWDQSVEYGHPPSYYSHNLYLQTGTEEATFRRNYSSRSPGTAMQWRCGTVREDNIFSENMAGASVPDYDYQLIIGEIWSSVGVMPVRDRQPVIGQCGPVWGRDHALIDCIVAHAVDPQNPDEALTVIPHNYPAGRPETKAGFRSFSGYEATPAETIYDNTIVYAWEDRDKNAEGLDTARADEATLFDFAATKLGHRPAALAEFHDYLRTLEHPHEIFGEVRDFIRSRMGKDISVRDSPAELRFIPDPRADGVRWDNRINWSTGDLPRAGDRVDLGGNVVYSSASPDGVRRVDLNGGELVVNGGLMAPDMLTGPGGVTIRGCGQLNAARYAAEIGYSVQGGRLDLSHADGAGGVYVLDADGDAEILIGAGTLAHVEDMTIMGPDVCIGFDGADGGVAGIKIPKNGHLLFSGHRFSVWDPDVAWRKGDIVRDDGRFFMGTHGSGWYAERPSNVVADDEARGWVEIDAPANGLSTIREIQSGITGIGEDGRNVPTDVVSRLQIDGKIIVEMNCVPGELEQTLIEVDQLVGEPRIVLTGLGDRDATVTITATSLHLRVTAGGAGEVEINDQR